ncbi:MAG TPA: hypothetical protein PLZ52_08515 [Bacteroidales bacterium]|nr:hypothetical protein [Bacteroidales bacterium]HOE05244.1 hypothetical protein [Bacteroidales bacterium]
MKYFAIILFALVSVNTFAQSSGDVVPDNRLYARYSSEYIQNIMNSDPNAIAYMNYELDFGYTISDVGVEKASSLPVLYYLNTADKTIGLAVADIDESNVNIMLFNFDRLYDKANVYRIGNTGKVISFTSLKQLNKEFNQN